MHDDLKQHLRDGRRLKDLAHEEFVRAMRSGRMIAFVGSYLSEEFGYGDWSQMLHDVIGSSNAATIDGANSPSPHGALKQILRDLGKDKENAAVDLDVLKAYFEASHSGPREPELNRTDAVKWDDSKAKAVAKSNSVIALCDQLGITRFVTLNYDIELEYHLMPNGAAKRLNRNKFQKDFRAARRKRTNQRLGDADFRSSYDFQERRTLPDGRHVVSDCFHRERADRLFEFAIGSPDFHTHIMHLHGRITDPETMIVSHSDYEDQYQRNDVTRRPFEHAMRMLFAGNPVLFVGLGMSEPDVLAALREFVSEDRPGHVAPHFVIWNAWKGAPQTPDKVSDDDEIRRLRWYRRFGVHLIYDTEIPKFIRKSAKSGERLQASISSLAKYTQKKVVPFRWKTKQLRTMSGFLPEVGGRDDPNDQSWRDMPTVWPVEIDPNSVFWPSFRYDRHPGGIYDKLFHTAGTSRPEVIDDSQNLGLLLQNGAPIKAFIDPPGSGHGYIASVIRSFVTEQMRPYLLNHVTPAQELIYFQLNAGFSWEIDTTFALISGLYDHTLAFDRSRSHEAMSRRAANDVWLRQIRDLLQSSSPMKRNIFIAINGADRFFDSSGYPLSNELDILLRTVPLMSQNEVYYERKLGANSNFHPVTILLFGTKRVHRYLESLRIPEARIRRHGGGVVKGFDIIHQSAKEFGSRQMPARKWSLLDATVSQYKLAASPPPLPVQKVEGRFSSAYLRATEDAFLGRYNQLYPVAKKPKFPLEISLQTLLDLSRGNGLGEQRRAFFNAYLRRETLAKVVSSSTAKQLEKAELCLYLLRLMAFVGQPVECTTLEALRGIYQLNKLMTSASQTTLQPTLDLLEELNLVSRIGAFPGTTTRRYALHRALLHEIRDRNTIPISDARTYTSFNLPLFAAQPIDDHEPEKPVQDELDRIVDELTRRGKEKGSTGGGGPMLRAACASLRSYHTTSSLLMHEPENGTSAKRSPKLGDHARRIDALILAMQEVDESAFPEDLVWLHAQRGVALLAQGNLYESRHAFNQADEINHHFVEIGDHGQNWTRIEVNKLHLDIERGKISHAEARINRIESALNRRADDAEWSKLWEMHDEPRAESRPGQAIDAVLEKYGGGFLHRTRIVDPVFPAEIVLITGLLRGYKGWCEYNRGRLRTARHCLDQACSVMRNIGEQRAYSMFMRHQTAVLKALGKREEALETINLCIAAADSARQMDISHLAWIDRADLEIAPTRSEDRGRLLQQMLATLRYATLTDMFRVRMEARRALAKLRFTEGDYDGALEQAAESLAIATRFGFSLRKISLRILIGQILIQRGDPISGHAMLDQATRIADRVGYQRAVEQAHAARSDATFRQ